MGNELRRREMVDAEGGGTRTEVWVDFTISSENTSIGTVNNAPLPSAVRTQMNQGINPSRIYVRFYPVLPESGVVTQSARLCVWRSGVGIVTNISNANQNSGESFDCSDGTEIGLESVLEYLPGDTPGYYKVTSKTNRGVSHVLYSSKRVFYSGGSVPANLFFTVRTTSSGTFGIGSRLLVIAEYDD